MIQYKYNGKVEQMKSLQTEITVKEFQEVAKAQENFLGNFMYYLNTFEILGLSEEFINKIDDKTLYQLIRDFQNDFIIDKTEYVKEITVEGYTYRAFENEFVLGARDLADIEEKMSKDPFNWVVYALAIIFKREDLSAVEHKAKAHRKHKEKLFSNITMDIALPYIMYISESYIENIKMLAS